MNETLHRNGHIPAYLCYFFERQFPCKHCLRESDALEKAAFLRRAVVALRAGMKCYRRQIHPEQRHVLDNDRIDPGTVQIMHETLHIGNLAVIDYSVHRHVDAGAEPVGKLHRLADIPDGIGGTTAGAVTRSSHIDGIGTVEDCLARHILVGCRGEKFKRSCHFLKNRSIERLSSRSRIAWRLSYCFFPRPTPICILA